MEVSFSRMKSWLDHFNLEFVQAHCSGHICGPDLGYLIEEIKPKILFPIHTEYPGMFRKLSPITRMVKEEKTYVV